MILKLFDWNRIFLYTVKYAVMVVVSLIVIVGLFEFTKYDKLFIENYGEFFMYFGLIYGVYLFADLMDKIIKKYECNKS